jgi:hypothetical protein
MTDDGLDRLSSLEQSALLAIQLLVFAPVLDINPWVVLIHAPITQTPKEAGSTGKLLA